MLLRFKHIFILTTMFVMICSLFLHAQSKIRRRGDKFIFNNKERTITYISNTRMEDDASLIRSHQMIFHIDEERGEFDGNVSIFDKKNNMTIYAEDVNYDGIAKYADARIAPRVVSIPNNLVIRSVIMLRDFNTPFAIARRNVHLVNTNDGRRTDGYSDLLEYNVDTKIAYMTGSPILLQEDDILKGEVIEYNTVSGVANIMGGAIAYIAPQEDENTNNSAITDKNNSTQSKFTNYNIIKASRFEFETTEGKRMIYAYGNVSVYYPEENMILSGGQLAYDIESEYAVLSNRPVAKIPNRKTIVYSEWLEYIKADEYKDIIFHNNVLMFDYEENMLLEGQSIVIDPDTKVATSKGDPITYLEDRQVRIKANTFQRFNTQEKLRANGDVIIDQNDMNAKTDWALYYDQLKEMRLIGGNTVLIQDGNAIYAREVIYNVDTGEAESSMVSGVLE